ncbi:MAG: 16S rRNA (cytosine(1402)-N(4))-methyltransferase RsmH [Chloroflexota bacterium]|nr:16S rRNA (cytosine(1402)-N(4))-methyltransferase RsmH [Chloroflexota bacterium]
MPLVSHNPDFDVQNRISHIPVLLDLVLNTLLPPDAAPERDPASLRAIDGTVGAGGHGAALLARGVGSLLGLDLDPVALKLAAGALEPYGARATLVHASYTAMADAARDHGWDGVDIILLDLGVSSMQFDTPERGFAFRHDAPLDMRFDPESGGVTAADLVNTLDDRALADILYRYGEERESRRIARAIMAARPLHTTRALADVIEREIPRYQRKSDIHPATKTFQALRIAVNDELASVEAVIPTAFDLLRPGGRLGIISFHSLEDRIVKDAFKLAATDCICPPRIPICVCGHHATVALITRKPLIADDAEIALNPRSRSAKYRVVEKL